MAKFVVKSFVRIVLVVFFACVFMACKRWQYTRKVAPVSPTKKYTLMVTGVECKQCVMSVLKTLESIKGLKHVQCHCRNKQYEQAFFTCATPVHASLPIDSIAHRLERDDFVLQSIGGTFDGTLSFDTHDAVIFVPVGSELAYHVQAQESVIAEVRERAKVKPAAQLSGILKKDTKQFIVTNRF